MHRRTREEHNQRAKLRFVCGDEQEHTVTNIAKSIYTRYFNFEFFNFCVVPGTKRQIFSARSDVVLEDVPPSRQDGPILSLRHPFACSSSNHQVTMNPTVARFPPLPIPVPIRLPTHPSFPFLLATSRPFSFFFPFSSVSFPRHFPFSFSFPVLGLVPFLSQHRKRKALFLRKRF